MHRKVGQIETPKNWLVLLCHSPKRLKITLSPHPLLGLDILKLNEINKPPEWNDKSLENIKLVAIKATPAMSLFVNLVCSCT